MTEPIRLEVGRIGKAHGLRGEVLLTLSSNRVERVAKGSVLFVAGEELTIVASRPHQGKHLVLFDGVRDRNKAETLRGEIVEAEPLEDSDELWVHELLGAEVVGLDGEHLGSVQAVEPNPASDLLVLDDDVLVPLTFLVDRNDAGQLIIDPPDGLFDLNKSADTDTDSDAEGGSDAAAEA